MNERASLNCILVTPVNENHYVVRMTNKSSNNMFESLRTLDATIFHWIVSYENLDERSQFVKLFDVPNC